MKNFFLLGSLLLLCSTICTSAAAVPESGGIGLDVTRVIFPSSAESVSLRVNNTSASDVWLLRAWVSNPVSVENNLPFLITPPLVRINQDERIQFRINKLPEAEKLPKDRESLFNINVMAIPPKSESRERKNGGSLQFSVNSRIKLFYRPDSINIKKKVENIINELKVSKTDNAIQISNVTPYYATLDKIIINGKPLSKQVDYMVAPFSTLSIPARNVKTFSYQLINDFGGWSKIVNISL